MGIDEDDYETFLGARAAKLWVKIDERINPKFSSSIEIEGSTRTSP